MSYTTENKTEGITEKGFHDLVKKIIKTKI